MRLKPPTISTRLRHRSKEGHSGEHVSDAQAIPAAKGKEAWVLRRAGAPHPSRPSFTGSQNIDAFFFIQFLHDMQPTAKLSPFEPPTRQKLEDTNKCRKLHPLELMAFMR